MGTTLGWIVFIALLLIVGLFSNEKKDGKERMLLDFGLFADAMRRRLSTCPQIVVAEQEFNDDFSSMYFLYFRHDQVGIVLSRDEADEYFTLSFLFYTERPHEILRMTFNSRTRRCSAQFVRRFDLHPSRGFYADWDSVGVKKLIFAIEGKIREGKIITNSFFNVKS